ncbi:MAG TPA: hypothetical protein VMV72_10450 [Verrucomicrobiae bacterium]|nr:hypothetical protein [Verrucomicrobiae bacterium]
MKTRTSQTDSPLAQMVESDNKSPTIARRFAPSVLEIPMLFDDDNARGAGENLCRRVLAQLGPRYAVHLLPWNLSVTRFPVLTDIVAREAMWSPFFLVTINGEKVVTPEVEAFIRRCAAAMQRAGAALVVQLYGISKAQQESSPSYQCLKRIAADAKIPVFSTVVELKHKSRGAGRASPNRSVSPFVAVPPQTPPKFS